MAYLTLEFATGRTCFRARSEYDSGAGTIQTAIFLVTIILFMNNGIVFDSWFRSLLVRWPLLGLFIRTTRRMCLGTWYIIRIDTGVPTSLGTADMN